MHQIGIVYFSKTDITKKLVDAAVAGIEGCGANVFLHSIDGTEIVEGRFLNTDVFQSLKKCDGIIFATPTYMGGAAAQFKAFADATSVFWETQDWAGKLAGGITSGTGLNGDQTCTLQYFSTLASQHGMLWVNLDTAYGAPNSSLNRLGCQLGVVAQSNGEEVNNVDLETAKYLGRRISEWAANLQ